MSDNETEFSTGKYALPKFWDSKYQEYPGCYEWYCCYSDIREQLLQYVSKEHKILYIGAGTSYLAIEMNKEGFNNISCMDVSEEACKQMMEKISTKNYKVDYYLDNVFAMKAESGSFDIIIDKGLLDSLVCKEDCNSDIEKMMNEINRVLCRQGKYLCISHTNDRSIYFKKNNIWTDNIEVIDLSINNQIEGNNNIKNIDSPYLHVITKP